jgi:hypothetical protein
MKGAPDEEIFGAAAAADSSAQGAVGGDAT